MKRLMILFIIVFSSLNNSQNKQWITFNTSNSGLSNNAVIDIAIDRYGNKWIGTWGGGLAKFDGNTWNIYNSATVYLPIDNLQSLAADQQGVIWMGFGGGLAKYDGKAWAIYNTTNSGLKSDYVDAVAIDLQGNIWAGTGYGGGLAKYDGQTWSIYNLYSFIRSLYVDSQGNIWAGGDRQNMAKYDGQTWFRYSFGINAYSVKAIAVDQQGIAWVGSAVGLHKFDGKNWTKYDNANSGLPSESVHAVAIDQLGNKWIGTLKGLAKYDGHSWTVYNKSNSGLPGDSVRSITIDQHGNKWIGTWDSGLSVFREDGVILTDIKTISGLKPDSYSLSQNFPNPFNPATTINYSIPTESFVVLKVFDLLGREITTLVNSEQPAGDYKIQFDGSSLPSGVYIYSMQAGSFRNSKKLLLQK